MTYTFSFIKEFSHKPRFLQIKTFNPNMLFLRKSFTLTTIKVKVHKGLPIKVQKSFTVYVQKGFSIKVQKSSPIKVQKGSTFKF